jgi:ubiquitin carboxyl-terminal hydrolase L5
MQVDPALLASARNVLYADEAQIYAQDFGSRKFEKSIEIMNMPEESLISAWERCVQNALRAKLAVDDEVTKGLQASVSIYDSHSPKQPD